MAISKFMFATGKFEFTVTDSRDVIIREGIPGQVDSLCINRYSIDTYSEPEIITTLEHIDGKLVTQHVHYKILVRRNPKTLCTLNIIFTLSDVCSDVPVLIIESNGTELTKTITRVNDTGMGREGWELFDENIKQFFENYSVRVERSNSGWSLADAIRDSE